MSKLGLVLKKKAEPLSRSTTINLSASAPPVIDEVMGPGNFTANNSSVVIVPGISVSCLTLEYWPTMNELLSVFPLIWTSEMVATGASFSA